MPYKTFAHGEPLAADEVNQYLMRQAVIQVSGTDERDEIPSPIEGMLVSRPTADGRRVMDVYTPAGWVPALGHMGAAELDAAPDGAFGQALTRHANVTARRQAQHLGSVLRRLAYNVGLTIACQGDSTTYGHDTTSADRVAADPTPAGDGTPHTFTRSPAPWPARLAARLNDAHQGAVTVINRGFSGDTVLTGYDRWPASSGAHLTMFMYGQNDAPAMSVQEFIAGYERLILREINERAAAVVILHPARSLSHQAGRPAVEVLRNALDALAAVYGIPVIDTETFFAGFDSRTHSDGAHLNTLGNDVFGSRLAATLIGQGPHLPMRVMHGSKLSTRVMVDNLVLGSGNAVPAYTNATETAPDAGTNADFGLDLRLGGDNTLGHATFSFYTETPDLAVIPYYVVNANTALQIQLDYNIEQGDAINDFMVGDPASTTTRQPGQLQIGPTGSTVVQNSHATGANFLRIVNPGWHTLRVWGGASGSANHVRLRGLEFLDYTTLRAIQAAGV